jgi:hypothetical protein
MSHVEARSRLISILDVVEHELKALEAIGDPRLRGAVGAMTTLRAEIVAALAELEVPPGEWGEEDHLDPGGRPGESRGSSREAGRSPNNAAAGFLRDVPPRQPGGAGKGLAVD